MLWIVSGVILMGGAAQAGAATPQQIVQRCERAYDLLQSYKGIVTVTATSTQSAAYHTSAIIDFARPDKIYVHGNGMMNSQYAYVSNGSATYQKMGGHWARSQSIGMALAGATGLAQGAATTVPALLLHTQWGRPFPATEKFDPVVEEDTVAGHPCFKLSSVNPLGRKTYWIDKQTFLLRRFDSTLTASSFSLHQDELMTHEQFNCFIPASAFKLPPSAGRTH